MAWARHSSNTLELIFCLKSLGFGWNKTPLLGKELLPNTGEILFYILTDWSGPLWLNLLKAEQSKFPQSQKRL